VDDLVQWLGEQLKEDERTARATTWDGSGNKLSWELAASATIDVGGDEFYVGDRTIANHMMAWDPARVLREIEAKRQIIEQHKRYAAERRRMMGGWDPQSDDSPILAALATAYADRPGYREEWRP
jgi:hypothetical protein